MVWPVVLGIGPIKGVAAALSRLGLKEPQQFMFEVMEYSLRAYKGAWVTEGWGGGFTWPSDLVPGFHEDALVQWGGGYKGTEICVSPALIRYLRSVVRRQSVHSPLHLKVGGGGG